MTRRKIPLPPETAADLEKQLEAFRQKFGRDPGPNDPVFFDPDADAPQPISEEALRQATLTAMRKAGIPPHLIYAYERTGYLLTAENMKLVPHAARAEWNAAIEEYLAMEAAASGEKH
jgi:integrase